ncbi:MAG TPA: N-methyl-L-tryptophan oxidase [Pirellulales bacterium]|jgi:sarcosine oxidase|nr:N-methyl-L-tryptophan oxidase [Pirellulales bacterium]
MKTCDVIVIGAGGVGTAAAAEVARRGARAIAIDRFPPGHDRGSSHGQTRIIRQAYFEHADYVPLLADAYRRWHGLEQRRGERLLDPVGLIEIGPAGGTVVGGVLASAAAHRLDVEQLSAGEIERNFPGLRVPETLVGVFERQAGYLHVERAVVAQAAEAESHGAALHVGENVLGWRAQGGGVEVQTDRDRYSAERLIVSAGAWAGPLLADLKIPLRVLRKAVYWFEPEADVYRSDRGMPTFLFDLPAASPETHRPAEQPQADEREAGSGPFLPELGNCFYGFPQIDWRGVKVAEHSGGTVVDDAAQVDRRPDPTDERRVIDFCRAHLPRLSDRRLETSVCLYTMTPDGHFVVDRHPEHPQVAFAAGLSGHGFKFVPVLGQILADLALDGRTSLPIDFLSCRRPALAARG